MKLIIYKKDGAYEPKCKGYPVNTFWDMAKSMHWGNQTIEFYEGDNLVVFDVSDINAIALETPTDKKPHTSIMLPFEGGCHTMHYNDEYAASSQFDRVNDAQDKDYKFIPFDSSNCKLVVRTECVKGTTRIT